MQTITVSIADAVAMTGLNAATLQRMIERDEIGAIKIGWRVVKIATLKQLAGVA